MSFKKIVAAVVVGEAIATFLKGAMLSYVRKNHPEMYAEALRRREG